MLHALFSVIFFAQEHKKVEYHVENLELTLFQHEQNKTDRKELNHLLHNDEQH